MEDLEQQKRIISLGKLLVQELGVEDSNDTLSRWMAHHLSEKIVIAAESSPGKDKDEAAKTCFDTILKLWEHRRSMPSGRRPLENFEPILETLSKLNPEKERTFYFELPDNHRSPKPTEVIEPKYLRSNIETAVQIDKAARIWIDDILRQAALKAKDENTEAVLENALSLSDDDDIRVVQLIIEDSSEDDSIMTSENNFRKKLKLEKLQKRVENLEKFKRLSDFLLEEYKNGISSNQEKS